MTFHPPRSCASSSEEVASSIERFQELLYLYKKPFRYERSLRINNARIRKSKLSQSMHCLFARLFVPLQHDKINRYCRHRKLLRRSAEILPIYTHQGMLNPRIPMGNTDGERLGMPHLWHAVCAIPQIGGYIQPVVPVAHNGGVRWLHHFLDLRP